MKYVTVTSTALVINYKQSKFIHKKPKKTAEFYKFTTKN